MPPETTRTFTTKSAFRILNSPNSLLEPTLYPGLWQGRCPRKVKFFCWELSHGAIKTHDKLPHFALTPNCCHLCFGASETQDHLVINCAFATSFWNCLLSAFGWKIVLHNQPSLFLNCLLVVIHSERKKLPFGFNSFGHFCGAYGWRGMIGSSRINPTLLISFMIELLSQLLVGVNISTPPSTTTLLMILLQVGRHSCNYSCGLLYISYHQ